jgi:molybdopterin molybdotransferase
MPPIPEHLPTDVRMRGFTNRATVEAALDWIDSAIPAFDHLHTEVICASKAATRILAQDVTSRVDVPSFARSMMDGFALRSQETHGASSYNRLPFKVIGTCLPGVPFSGRIETGQAVRIMTGAPLPAGADAVLPVENTELDGDTMLSLDEVSSGKHVGMIGEDIRNGDIVVRQGRQLRPQDIGVISSIGVSHLSVVRRPQVRIVITGNELLPSGAVPSGYQIADANGPMLAALIDRDGGEVIFPGIVRDEPDSIRQALLDPADIVLVSGGSSVGQEDFAPKLLAELGEVAIHGIAMRPSSPTGMGLLQGRPVFLLPGNPVSCLCAYDFFAGRAIRAVGGRSRDWPYRRVLVRLARKLVSTVGRVDYARVQIHGNEATPMAIGGASILSSATRSDGFVVVPSDSEGFPEGDEVEVFLY